MTMSLTAPGLENKVAVVTGGAGSLGGAVADHLAALGCIVAVTDINPTAVQTATDRLKAGSPSSLGLVGDMAKEADVERVFAEVLAHLDHIDILVNAISAPVQRYPVEEFPLAAWTRMLDTNLTAFFLTSREAARHMIAGKHGGSIVNFSSIAGRTALGRGSVAYSAAKGGVEQLTRECAYAWAPHMIRVNAVLPCQFLNAGWQTILNDPDAKELVANVLHGIPAGRLGEPKDIVGAVAFLASEAASMVTGAFLPVDGGNLIMNAGATLDW